MKAWKKAIILLILILLVSLPLIGTAVADMGGFSGNSDFGGGGSSSSDDCDGIGWLIYYGLRLGCAIGDCAESSGVCTKGQVLVIESVIVIIIAITVILLRVRSKKDDQNAAKRVQEMVSRAQANRLQPVQPSAGIGSRIRALDPNFSEEDLKEQIKNLYFRLIECRGTGDLEPVRPYLSEQFCAETEAEFKAERRRR